MNLIQKTLKTFNMDLPNFAREIDVPKSTLQTWSDKIDSNEKIPRYAIVMLESLIELKQLKIKDAAVKRVLELYGVIQKS